MSVTVLFPDPMTSWCISSRRTKTCGSSASMSAVAAFRSHPSITMCSMGGRIARQKMKRKGKNPWVLDSINSVKTSSKPIRTPTQPSCPSSLPAGWRACLRSYSLKAARDARKYLQTSASFIHTCAPTRTRNPLGVLNWAAACRFARRGIWSSIGGGCMRAGVGVVVVAEWMVLALDASERGRDRFLPITITLKMTAREMKKYAQKDRIRDYDQMFEGNITWIGPATLYILKYIPGLYFILDFSNVYKPVIHHLIQKTKTYRAIKCCDKGF